MAIVVTFNEYNGSAETETAGITNIAFGSGDVSGLTTKDYPIRVGSSYEKYLKATIFLYADSQPFIAYPSSQR